MSEFRPRGRPWRERPTARAEGLHSYVGAVRGRVHSESAMSADDLLAETTDPEQQPARIISAFGTRKDPVSWNE